ncbi:RNA polymerase sigma factor [Teredinibacter sp. KSP-S5-2]|uniref:RNA polymerase sigma factor n=1 Tax=Teredinibacter sp. KSP-S5-2 TaxID=3034506 RepID=UPI002934AFF1|nr:sigma-70 family RNA polymerase sigma factor [Teredinibacter sp. KSP-S5-2]WNO08036.1 sigma-70 family RNA polymerase sigma factor [Teredinibacter sp. KSP-S5-2]
MSSESGKINLKQLYQEHSDGLTSFLTRKYDNQELAEDAMQTTFTRLSSNQSRLKNVQNIPGYLYRMAENLVVDHFRHKSVEDKYYELKTDIYKNELEFGSPEITVEAQRQLIKVQTAIESMPKKVRKAFLLHRMHGLSYSQIAEKMQVSVSSVEKYMLQALRTCRSTINE